MAREHKDYRSYHLNRLKDNNAAACFLAAALEDAIAENDVLHFIRASQDVAQAQDITIMDAINVMKKHCGSDAHNVEENKNILLIKLAEIVETMQRDHLQEA